MEKQKAIIDVLLSKIKKEDSLPPLSNNSLSLQKEIINDDPDLEKIESMIKTDPSLTSHVLRVANSVVYKGLNQIATVKEAMLRLGTNELKNIVSWAIHKSNFQAPDPFIKSCKEKLWFHSLSCAVGSLWAAKYLNLDMDKVVSKAFISGLLHDMGALCLLTALEKIKTKNEIKEYPSEFVLKELISKFHTQQGYDLLKYWNLPMEYCIIARDHDAEEFDQTNLLLTLIRLVNKICHKIEKGSDPEEMANITSSVEAKILGVSEIGVAEIEIEIEASQEKFNTLMK